MLTPRSAAFSPRKVFPRQALVTTVGEWTGALTSRR